MHPATDLYITVELSQAWNLLYNNMRLHENFEDAWIRDKIAELVGGVLHIVLCTRVQSAVPHVVTFLVQKAQDIGIPYTNYDTLATSLTRCVSECLLSALERIQYKDIKYVGMSSLTLRATVQVIPEGNQPGLQCLFPQGA